MHDASSKGIIYLIPTVIAADTQAQVLAPQIREIANRLTYFLVENVRTARRFLSSLSIQTPISELQFELLSKKTAATDLPGLMKPALSGQDIGIMSEAGCPGVADPGARAVAYAHQQNLRVVPLVGPSSILLALMASGFSGQSFTFQGYLPIDKTQRIQAIKRLEKQSQHHRQTQIFMETPYRNNQLLADVVKHCQPKTLICVAKNINGSDEYIKTQPVHTWQKNLPDLHKVPTVFLLYSVR
ncbi:SAM-dependent methyltransferase [Tunicatimonas pelagia]|uniref:SAM-dependent methyltransferase n=1 Tax=Tunicatimonas pelagia TaxID=931531 RepID=UPI002666D177|nr:SAM-dependent methyltransferase [Tunicatimonas pelagia]WKN44550.1 SAM-dependent methyltransferase [Tunicatimonas pelagia]